MVPGPGGHQEFRPQDRPCNNPGAGCRPFTRHQPSSRTVPRIAPSPLSVTSLGCTSRGLRGKFNKGSWRGEGAGAKGGKLSRRAGGTCRPTKFKVFKVVLPGVNFENFGTGWATAPFNAFKYSIRPLGLATPHSLHGKLPLRCRPGPCQSVTGGPAASLENSSNRSFGLTPPTPNATISTGRALSTRFANKAGPQHKKVPQMAKPPARIGPDRGSLRARNRRYTWGVRLRPTSAQISLLPFATCQVLPWCELREAKPCAEEQRC